MSTAVFVVRPVSSGLQQHAVRQQQTLRAVSDLWLTPLFFSPSNASQNNEYINKDISGRVNKTERSRRQERMSDSSQSVHLTPARAWLHIHMHTSPSEQVPEHRLASQISAAVQETGRDCVHHLQLLQHHRRQVCTLSVILTCCAVGRIVCKSLHYQFKHWTHYTGPLMEEQHSFIKKNKKRRRSHNTDFDCWKMEMYHCKKK